MTAALIYTPPPDLCGVCAKRISQPETGRPRRYCSNACKCKSYRNRGIVRLAHKLKTIVDKMENAS